MFRKNTEVERIWLKWNDITDDFIWTDKEAKIEMNKKEHSKEIENQKKYYEELIKNIKTQEINRDSNGSA